MFHYKIVRMYHMPLFSHVDWFHDFGICRLYYVGSEHIGKLLFIDYKFKLNLEIWVELYSRHYAQDSLFIPILFIYITINSNIVTKKY